MNESAQTKGAKKAVCAQTATPPKPAAGLEAQLLRGVGHAIVGADCRGNIIHWNNAAESTFGWRAEEVMGKNAWQFVAPDFSEQQMQEISERLHAGETWGIQIRLRRRDGSRFEAAVINAPLRNEKQQLVGIVSSIRDITGRADGDAALQRMSAGLAEAQRIAKVGSWEWLPETGESYWSAQLFEMLDVEPTVEPSFEVFLSRVHPDDVERVEREVGANLASDRTETRLNYRVLLRDGSVKEIEDRSHITRNVEGRAIRLVGTCLDVSEARAANRELRASEERFRSLIKATAAVQWRTDASGKEVEATATWSEFTGLSAEQTAIPEGWLAALHPDDRGRAASTWRKATEGGVEYYCEYRLRRRDGEWRDVISRGVPVRNSDGSVREWIGTCVDVTELKAAQEAVRFQAQVLDTIGESVIATDPAGKIIYMNRFAGAQFGWSPEEAIGADIMKVTVPSPSRKQAEQIMHGVRRGETWSGEFTARRRDGGMFPIRGSNTPVYNDAGELVAIVGVARDMSEYQESQRALRESEERYRATFDQAAVGVCEITFDGTFKRVNPRLCQLFGYTADELLNLKFSDITHADDLPRSVALVGELSAEQRNFFAIEKRYVRKDGTAVWALSTVSLMRDRNGNPQSLIAIVEDISEQKHAELALRQREVELRTLTARLNAAREEEAKRIARELHDQLGQVLTAITLETAGAQRRFAEGNAATSTVEMQRHLATVRVLLDQAIGTTRRVCTELRPALLDQVGLIPALEWQAHDFESRSGIFCSLKLPDPAPEIGGELATALFRIFQETLTNVARHADAKEVTVDLQATPEEIRLTVQDDGRGLTESQATESTGLGLIGIRERATAVGGTVAFESAAGGGTQVSVVVPLRSFRV